MTFHACYRKKNNNLKQNHQNHPKSWSKVKPEANSVPENLCYEGTGIRERQNPLNNTHKAYKYILKVC